MVALMKRLFIILFILAGAFASVQLPPASTSNYSFTELSLTMDGGGGFTLKGDFQVVPSINDTRVYIIGPNDAFNVISSEPKLYFDENGYFFFSKESGSIEIIGNMVFEQSTALYFPAPTMRLSIKTPTYSDTFYSVTGKSVTIYRYKYKPAEQRVTPTYNIFLEKFGRSSFSYILDVQNPGQEIRMELKNKETIDSVDGARHKVVGNELVLYPEASNRIRIYGGFPGVISTFKPGLGVPGYVSVQYPSDFEVMTSGAVQVDESKVRGLENKYTNKVCFEVYSSSTLSISVQELDSVPSLVFAVNDGSNTVSISENGVILQNTRFQFSNTGLEYASFDVKDLEPLYASINGQATFLTTKDDKIYLAVPKRLNQNAEFITLDKKPELFVGGLIDLEVPRINYPISQFRSTIYYPSDYEVLYSSQGTGFGWEGFIFIILIMTGFIYIVIPGVGKKRIFTALLFALSIFLLNQVSSLFFFFALVGYAYSIYKKYKDSIKFERNTRNIVIAAVIGLIVMGAIFMTVVLLATTFFTSYSAPAAHMETDSYNIARSPLQKEMGAGAVMVPSEEIGLVTEKEILPVKLSLPKYSNRISMTHHMVTQDKPLKVQMLLVHTWLVKLIYAVLGLVLLGVAWRRARA